MQQARLTNAVECKAEVGLRAIAVRMGVLSNGTLRLTTVYWRPRCIRREFVRNSTLARGAALIISTIRPAAGEFCDVSGPGCTCYYQLFSRLHVRFGSLHVHRERRIVRRLTKTTSYD